MIVVDASFLTDFLLGRRQTLEVIEQEFIENASPMHAPELVELESLNALRRLVIAQRITEQRASEAVADLDDVRLVRYPHAPLRPRVWELRHDLTAYDATYLSLAEALEGSVLMTSDCGLAAQASNSLGADRVRHIR